METVKSMEINEKKQYRVCKQNARINKYSDHNVILINIDFISSKAVSRIKKVITSKGYNKYQTTIQEVVKYQRRDKFKRAIINENLFIYLFICTFFIVDNH